MPTFWTYIKRILTSIARFREFKKASTTRFPTRIPLLKFGYHYIRIIISTLFNYIKFVNNIRKLSHSKFNSSISLGTLLTHYSLWRYESFISFFKKVWSKELETCHSIVTKCKENLLVWKYNPKIVCFENIILIHSK